MLLRRFIGERLAAYYAQSADAVVGGLCPQPLSSLWGHWHWTRLYHRLYQETKGQWLTPVELFQPYYSQTIANYIVQCCSNSNDVDPDDDGAIDIVELGGGRGTNARHVMDHLRAIRPDLYERASYKIIDASPSLHALQQNVLMGTSHAAVGKFKFVCQDLLQAVDNPHRPGVDPLLTRSDNLTIVIALEVMDNLPHDKIRIRGTRNNMVVDQAIVRHNPTSNSLEEVFVPLDDALLQRVLHLYPAVRRNVRFAWVPTVICGVLDQVHQRRPNLRLMLADFDWLPRPDHTTERRVSQRAHGEPLVTDMDDVDGACYLSSQSRLCDILFPTDFDRLANFVGQLTSGGSSPAGDASRRVKMTTTTMMPTPHVQKQADFLQTHGPEQVAATKSWLTGFTPMLGDFSNCSVLTTNALLSDSYGKPSSGIPG